MVSRRIAIGLGVLVLKARSNGGTPDHAETEFLRPLTASSSPRFIPPPSRNPSPRSQFLACDVAKGWLSQRVPAQSTLITDLRAESPLPAPTRHLGDLGFAHTAGESSWRAAWLSTPADPQNPTGPPAPTWHPGAQLLSQPRPQPRLCSLLFGCLVARQSPRHLLFVTQMGRGPPRALIKTRLGRSPASLAWQAGERSERRGREHGARGKQNGERSAATFGSPTWPRRLSAGQLAWVQLPRVGKYVGDLGASGTWRGNATGRVAALCADLGVPDPSGTEVTNSYHGFPSCGQGCRERPRVAPNGTSATGRSHPSLGGMQHLALVLTTWQYSKLDQRLKRKSGRSDLRPFGEMRVSLMI